MPATRGLNKDSDKNITPAEEAVHVPAHLALPGSPQAKQLRHLHAQLSLGQSCHRRKRKSCVYTHRSLRSCPTLYEAVDCGLPGFSVRGVLQERILGCTGQYWLPYPSEALYFLPPRPPTPLSTWCCQNPCDPSSCTTSTPGPQRGQTQVLQGSFRSKPH